MTRRRTLTLVALAATGTAGVAAAPAAAAWPGLAGRLAVTQRAPADVPGDVEDLEVLVVGRDGEAHQVTRNRTTDAQPTWSPDGRAIAFRGSRSGREQVYVMAPDGTGQRRVSRDADRTVFSSQPAWAPAGDRIVFRSNRDTLTRKAELYTMDLAGDDVRRLTTTPEHDERYPSLSPDGTRLLFTSDRGGSFGIWVANADGSDPRPLVDTPLLESGPAWSPDGTHVAFEREQAPGAPHDVFVVAADGTGERQVTGDPAHDEGPAWSPDGARLAFTSERDGDSDTWVAAADGTGAANLTATDRYEESPDWQPLPYTRTTHAPCGDLALTPGGASGVVAAKAPCHAALRVAGRWARRALAAGPPAAVRGYACASAPHTFDQVVVECLHAGGRKGVAFVWRAPAADPSAAALAADAPAGAAAAWPEADAAEVPPEHELGTDE